MRFNKTGFKFFHKHCISKFGVALTLTFAGAMENPKKSITIDSLGSTTLSF